MLHYTYTASGQKISQQLDDNGQMGTRREYAGSFVYVNSALGWVNTTYGRIVALPRGGLRKELHLRDHTSTSFSTGLGNTRMVLEEIDSKYEVVQEAAYYPFGMAIPSQSFALPNQNDTYQNRYLYNGKELQDDFGLDWYDYGTRMYDAALGRFHSVDPLTENFTFQSPYVYAANNPIRFIDYMGMSSEEPDPGAEKNAEDDEETRRQEEQAAQEAARQAEQDALVARMQKLIQQWEQNGNQIQEVTTTEELMKNSRDDLLATGIVLAVTPEGSSTIVGLGMIASVGFLYLWDYFNNDGTHITVIHPKSGQFPFDVPPSGTSGSGGSGNDWIDFLIGGAFAGGTVYLNDRYERAQQQQKDKTNVRNKHELRLKFEKPKP